MHSVWKSIVLLICGCQLAPLVVGDCPYKECQCYGTYINCQELGLTAMPICYSTNATGYLALILDTNHITEISAGSLPTGLSEISLIDNPITTIDDNVFDELSTTLESLYFMNAQLARIPDAFLHLNSLEHLNIIDNTIDDWNIGAMAHIGETLQTLNLENVGLTTWPVWLAFCQNLNELNLDGNAISSMPDNAFDQLSNSLLTLTLSNNMFTATPKSLSKLNNVITLNLQNNKLCNITWLPQSSKLSGLALNNNHISDPGHLSSVLHPYAGSLSSLSLSYNQLRAIPDLSFLTMVYDYDLSHNQLSDPDHLSSVLHPYAGSLSSLSLSYNQLRAIPDLSFLTMVYDYDLSHNQLSDPASGRTHGGIYVIDFSYNLLPSIPTIYQQMQRLSQMSLAHNMIHAVQGADIPPWITSLDLQYNLVTELIDSSFPVNSRLQQVTLDYNPIVKISNLAFTNLADVGILTMQHTKLTRLPLSLAYLTDARYLDISNNPDLVCTCLEKSLKAFVMRDFELSGNCGDISIYDFMSLLSPSCP